MKGDVTLTHTITVGDALQILRALVNLPSMVHRTTPTMTDFQKAAISEAYGFDLNTEEGLAEAFEQARCNARINAPGDISVKDALLILRYLVRLPSELGGGSPAYPA
jgi:hypothetical protein